MAHVLACVGLEESRMSCVSASVSGLQAHCVQPGQTWKACRPFPDAGTTRWRAPCPTLYMRDADL